MRGPALLASRFAALTLLLAAVSPPTLARPPHSHHAAPKQKTKATTKAHKVAAAKSRKAKIDPKTAPIPATADPQTLVSRGKHVAFFDPQDLSQSPIISAPSGIIIDCDTGQTLWAKNADEKHYPASTTKILTALLFIEHCPPNETITCLDPNITKIEESSLHIKPWEKFTAQDLLYGFLLRSANDGAVLIAEHIAGSVPKFAEMMNARALQLGATHSHWVTPNGLHDPNHYTTARDMALIAREAMKNPRFEDAVGTPERYITRSILMQDSHIVAKSKRQFYDKFPGADGVKTGYTHNAKHCFVGSATREGRRLLSVVFGSYNSGISDTIPMLSWAFQRFAPVPLAHKGDAVAPVPVMGGTSRTVSAIADADLHVSVDTLAPDDRTRIRTEVIPENAVAPIRKNAVVAHLVARLDGNVVGEAPLIATEDLPRSAFAAVSPGSGGNPVGRVFFWIASIAAVLLIAWRYGATAAKSARRRRSSVAATRRGFNRLG